MAQEIILVPISLDILIPTIAASLIATLVPYSWNKQKENFQHKLKIIEEHTKVQRDIHEPLISFYSLLNWKYRAPFLENNKFVWKMRSEPLDDKKHLDLEDENLAMKYNQTKNTINENFINRVNGYLQLYIVPEMRPLIDDSAKLLGEAEKLLFNISYDPDQIPSIEEQLKKIQSNFTEIQKIHNKILKIYMKRFRKKYWFARRLQDIKNLRK